MSTTEPKPAPSLSFHASTRFAGNRNPFHSLSRSFSLLACASLAALLVLCRAYATAQPVYPAGSLAQDARGQGAGACRMSFMSPSYLRLDGFGREYTRLGAGPWGLYLYREAGWDPEPFAPDGSLSLSGSPVVFVPGNAGSFRQVRSLASVASRGWWELPGIKKKGAGGKGGASLDFFAMDFNDDFSAFHGQTLLDQSEYLADAIRYILSLYQTPDERPDPTSVIVVAHSMGGIVSRAAFLHPHYQRHSISTLITIATPHAIPPVTVDKAVETVYEAINSYWRKGYGLESTGFAAAAREELENVVTISIGGGISDITIASEAVSLAGLVPEDDRNGFTVFTTSIPGVSTPIDHLALLWCQQLLSLIADGLLAIVDTRVPTGVVSRELRIARLGERLLGGLEIRSKKLNGRQVALSVLQNGLVAERLRSGERLYAKNDPREYRKIYIMPIPPTHTYSSPLDFTLLTSSAISRGMINSVEVYACAASSEPDLEEGLCTALLPSHVSNLPISPHSSVSPVLPAPIEEGVLGLVAFDVAEIIGRQSVVVVVKPGSGWIVAEFGDKVHRVHTVEKSVIRTHTSLASSVCAHSRLFRIIARRLQDRIVPDNTIARVGATNPRSRHLAAHVEAESFSKRLSRSARLFFLRKFVC